MEYSKLCFLAKSTTRGQFVLITYIVFFTEMQKSKPYEMDLPLLKTISQQL